MRNLFCLFGFHRWYTYKPLATDTFVRLVCRRKDCGAVDNREVGA